MDFLSKADCLTVLKRSLGGEDFYLERFSLESVSESPIGYMARHLRLVATVRIGGIPSDLHFFVKTLPASGSHLVYLEEMQHFQKELDMYEHMVPIMTASLPEGIQLPIPRCFLTRGAAGADKPELKSGRGQAETGVEDLIILEDLREKGYRQWDKMVPFDLGHCRSLMKSLSIFHASSFLLQKVATDKGRGDNFDYIDGIFRVAKDRLLTDTGGKMRRLWAKSSVDTMATAVAGLWPERFAGLNETMELKERLRKAWNELSELSKPSRTRTNVLCHGDLWVNNVMFKYEGEGVAGSVPLSAVLVDLQLVRFAPAATDLLIFFHTSTTRGFREEHMRDLVTAYHGHLREIVGEALLDQLMPLGSLLDCIEEYGLFGKLVSSVWLSFILNSEDVAPMREENGSVGEPPDFVAKILKDRGDEVLLNAEASEAFRTRMSESYRECLEHLGLWKPRETVSH